jgi:GH15 family glucan-1,4-alpha-glucosidase
LCFPRFDGPSVFAWLLDDHAGQWSIAAVGPSEVSRRYLDRTLALETTFHTPTGVAVLVDAMALGRHERGLELGVHSPGMVLRSVSCVSGTVEMELVYAPRFEYGLIAPQLRPVRRGIIARGGAAVLVLSSPIAFSLENAVTRARFTLTAGNLPFCVSVWPSFFSR